ncbi:hypothetical protein GCM10027416_17060 [Okibacterium endophyticum]
MATSSGNTPASNPATADPGTPAHLDAWLAALGDELDVDVSTMPVQLLLDVARDVAHNVIRPGAPLSTFVVALAAAKHGGGADAVREAAAKASSLAISWGAKDARSDAGGHTGAGGTA